MQRMPRLLHDPTNFKAANIQIHRPDQPLKRRAAFEALPAGRGAITSTILHIAAEEQSIYSY